MGLSDVDKTGALGTPDTPSEPAAPGAPTPPTLNPDVSRREFLTGAAALGTAALSLAAAGSLAACDDEDEPESESLIGQPTPPDTGEVPESLDVSIDQLIEVTGFEEQPLSEYLQETRRHFLPFGSVVYQINERSALALVPHGTGKELIDLSLLDLQNGQLEVLLEQAVGAKQGYPDAIIYDGRASESLLAWTECDIASLDWQVYAAPIQSGGLGPAVLIDQGGPDYEVPLLALTGNKIYWTVMPNPAGPAQYQDSYLKAMIFGATEPTVVYTSHGRMITTPLVNQGTLTFAPRVDTKNIYYQLTALRVADDSIADYLIMPQSVRISDALYMDKTFCFSIENYYTYAGGLGTIGTYRQLPDGEHWLHLSRQPSAPPLLLAGRLVVKSSIRVIGIDAVGQGYYSIPLLIDSLDYGDSLAGWGSQQNLVVYSNTSSNSCMLRVFEPV